MGWQPASQQAEQDIKEGKLGIARDRLNSLVVSFPNDVKLRSRLGDVYSKLGYPIEAGRFWFFDDDLTDEKREAIDLFIRRCKGDEAVILQHLKVRCDPGVLSSRTASKKVKELVAACEKRGIAAPDFKSKYNPTVYKSGDTLKDKIFLIGCVILLLILVTLTITGFITAIEWVRSL